ncbi:prepilin peptidase [Micromonospora sp. NPDC051925]|uniref:prepilin peptidase n=1 Tax=Micromonospora sp. NPDC051925 TaxID=3364288 RepID=UPI0037CA9E82
MSVDPVTAAATLGVLAGLAAPRIARAFPPVPAAPLSAAPCPAAPLPAAPTEVTGRLAAETSVVPSVGSSAGSPAGSLDRPLVSFLPGGRPGGSPIVVAVVGAVVFGGLAAARGPEPALPAFLLVAAVGLVLAVVDVTSLRLPDPLVGAAALGSGTALTGAAVAAGTPGRLPLALAGAALSFLLYVVLALLPRSRLGFGDVKLAAALGLPLGWLGWPALWLGLLLPHLLNGVVVLALLAVRRVRRDTTLPFGPALLAGAWLAAVLA